MVSIIADVHSMIIVKYKYTKYVQPVKDATIYLDRFQFSCPSGYALSAFHLQSWYPQGVVYVRYRYGCAKSSYCTDSGLLYTPWNDWGPHFGREFIYLDRHKPDCGINGALKYVRLQTNHDSRQFRYSYRCCNQPKKCRTITNPKTIQGHKGVNYLDRQSVYCPSVYPLMHSFKLESSNGKSWYQYECCRNF